MKSYFSIRSVLFSIFLLACSDSVALAQAASKYIRNENTDTAIVFIHGVLGDAVSTWTNGDSYWPKLLTTDHTFDGVDIFVLAWRRTWNWFVLVRATQ